MSHLGKVKRIFYECIAPIFICFTLAGLSLVGAAEVVDPQNIVIENVYVADKDVKDVPANILIRDKLLELLTKDVIPHPDNFAVLDANGGYLPSKPTKRRLRC